MKNIFTLLSILFFTASYSQNQLPNIGFESWTNLTMFENPDYWGSSNYAEFPIANCAISVDAQHLNYSVLLETRLVGTDTAFAYVYQGQVGDTGPEAGIPYSTPCDQLKGYYKYNIATGDTAIAMVMKFSGGAMVSMDLIPIVGVQNSWTAFTLAINPVAQDSIFFGFISSNPFVYPIYATPGSFLMVDNVSFSHSVNGPGPALNNYSFENWTPVSFTDPDGWNSFNQLLLPFGMSTVTSTTDAFSGTLAARLETIELTQFGDTLPGMLFFGELDQYGQPMIVPFTGTPTSITGQYKYLPIGSDVAYLSMQFMNNGSVIGGNMFVLNPSTGYSIFSVTTNLSGTPDSAIVGFSSGDLPGSILILDNVQFVGGNTGIDEMEEFSFSLYPNPVSDRIFIQTSNKENEMEIEILDLQGRIVLTRNSHNTEKAEIDIKSLSPGIYMVRLNNNENSSPKPFTVVR